jgi:hypothetical protein
MISLDFLYLPSELSVYSISLCFEVRFYPVSVPVLLAIFYYVFVLFVYVHNPYWSYVATYVGLLQCIV